MPDRDSNCLYELIKAFTELPGPGGDEWTVQRFLAERWRSRVRHLSLTPVGNLIAHVGGTGPRLMIAAHADEICFVVKHIAEDGFIWITSGQRDPEQRPTLRSSVFLPWGHPALIVVGALDDAFVRAADLMQARLPRAERCTIADAGHIVNIERADVFDAAVLGFLEKLEREPG